MTRALLRTGLPATAFLIIAGAVLAQNPPPPPAAPGRPAAQPPAAGQPGSPGAMPTAFRAKQILGSKVLIQNNTAVGTIDDIVLSDDGQVEYLIVSAEGGKLFTAPWEAAKFSYEQRTITLPITEVQFKTVPTFTVQTYPQFYAPAFRTEVYKVYGLTPREWRRLDRGLPGGKR